MWWAVLKFQDEMKQQERRTNKGKKTNKLRKNPVLPFLDFLVFIKENPQIYQGFSFLAEPTNSLEKEEKTPK